jgi:hypothetical protein
MCGRSTRRRHAGSPLEQGADGQASGRRRRSDTRPNRWAPGGRRRHKNLCRSGARGPPGTLRPRSGQAPRGHRFFSCDSCPASVPGGTSDKRAFIGCAERSGFAPFGALLTCGCRRLPDAWAGGGDPTAGLAARQRRKPYRFDRSRDPVGCGRVAHGGSSQSSSSSISAAKRARSSARVAVARAIAAPASSSS